MSENTELGDWVDCESGVEVSVGLSVGIGVGVLMGAGVLVGIAVMSGVSVKVAGISGKGVGVGSGVIVTDVLLLNAWTVAMKF